MSDSTLLPRPITTHHDGHGLLDAIRVEALDGPGPGGASHRYRIAFRATYGGEVMDDETIIQYQKGPRHEPGSTAGILDPVLLAIVEDRLCAFQSGPFASPEGGEALAAVRLALARLKARADRRAKEGSLGTYRPDAAGGPPTSRGGAP